MLVEKDGKERLRTLDRGAALLGPLQLFLHAIVIQLVGDDFGPLLPKGRGKDDTVAGEITRQQASGTDILDRGNCFERVAQEAQALKHETT